MSFWPPFQFQASLLRRLQRPRRDHGHNGTSADKISITRKSFDGTGHDNHRIWTVLVAVNGGSNVEKTLIDPLTDDEYQQFTNSRTKSSSHTEFRADILLDNKGPKNYFNSLTSQLDLQSAVCQGWPLRQISIHEELDSSSEAASTPSIHSILWEVLEDVNLWESCVLTSVRLCRTWSFDAIKPRVTPQTEHQPSFQPAQKAEYRILLVIARSFKRDRSERFRDCRPNLVLGPLLKITSWCNQRSRLPRVSVDVVRPGTLSELELVLERHKGIPYDLIHLDMHGRIDRSSSSRTPLLVGATAYLRFAKHYNERLVRFRDNQEHPVVSLMGKDESLCDVEVTDVALLLQKYGATKVALNACLSSYAQCEMISNMCHTFLNHDISHISAMSFHVGESAARSYYAAFYEALLVNGHTFLSAAAVGREALRADSRRSANALVPTNYHHITRVSSDDFWPNHGFPDIRIPLGTALLRLGAIMCFTSAVLPHRFPGSWSRFPGGRLSRLLLTSLSWYASTRWARQLQCAVRLPMHRPTKIFHQGENLVQLSSHVEIEHLVLEDRLGFKANQGAIYLWSGNTEAALGKVVARQAQVWMRTGFVDSVDIIRAAVFTSPLSSLRCFLRMFITRHKRDVAEGDGPNRRRLVVITDFDEFHDFYLRRGTAGKSFTEIRNGLCRMANFILRYKATLPKGRMEGTSLLEADFKSKKDGEDSNDSTEIGQAYLIITGSYDAERWRTLYWHTEKITMTIGRAVPHRHNVKPDW